MITRAVLAILLAGMLGGIAIIRVQHRRLGMEQDRRAAAAIRIAELDQVVLTLKRREASHRRLIRQLQADQQNIASAGAERERQIETLQTTEPAVRDWADTALPDAVVRMRNRLAAAGYAVSAVSASDTLSAAVEATGLERPDHQRPDESGTGTH